MNRNEFKREYNNVFDDVETMLQKPVLTKSQKKMADILSLLQKFQSLRIKNQMNNLELQMSELESEESPEQKGIVDQQITNYFS